MDTFSSDIPEEVSKLLTDLNVVKNLPVGCKFNVVSNTYSNAWSIFEKGLRFYNGETGNRTVGYLNRLIDRSIELSRKCPNYYKTIFEAVVSLENALNNLYQSYFNQPTVQAEISVLKLRIGRTAFENAVKSKPINIPKETGETSERASGSFKLDSEITRKIRGSPAVLHVDGQVPHLEII